MSERVQLTADLIEAFSGMFISPRFDNAVRTPPFHRKAWELYASDTTAAMVIAPREHAKSTALTTVYILAEALFKNSDYIVLVGSTEENAAEQLGNITEELTENDDLQREFGIKKFLRSSQSDVICELNDGHRFRIIAKGAEQRIRGKLWKGKRPNLLVCDDTEDDEQVENADRRAKFRRWFFRAARQALSKTGRIRVHGTILHEDSLLSRLRRNSEWKHLFYKAHAGFDDFSEILWPEQWPEKRLRARQREFVSDHDAPGYSQEFLNDPLDNTDAFLRKDEFCPMTPADHEAEKVIGAAADFAVSKADKANRTSFTVGGKDVSNLLHYVDERVGRWDTLEWIEVMFDIQTTWNPDVFWVEDGVIWKAIKALIYREMQVRDIRINIEAIPSIKDKATRGRSFQKRMRARHCRFDTEAEWFPGFEQELLRFTGTAQATLDDQFDSAALLSLGFDRFAHLEEEDFFTDDEIEFERDWKHSRRTASTGGRSLVTGY